MVFVFVQDFDEDSDSDVEAPNGVYVANLSNNTPTNEVIADLKAMIGMECSVRRLRRSTNSSGIEKADAWIRLHDPMECNQALQLLNGANQGGVQVSSPPSASQLQVPASYQTQLLEATVLVIIF